MGGFPIDISQAPYIVSLEDASGKHTCGGTIINNEWIVTAGHCGSLAMAHAGSTDQTNNGLGQRIEIAQTIFHPNYHIGGITNTGFDIALVRLAQPLCFNENVQPIKYASSSTVNPLVDLAPGKPAFISGWGQNLAFPNQPFPPVLFGAETEIVSDGDVIDAYSVPNNCDYAGTNFALGVLIGCFVDGIATTKGDRGGPAIVNINGEPILFGVTSFGCTTIPIDPAPSMLMPSIFTDVYEMQDFIDSYVGSSLNNDLQVVGSSPASTTNISALNIGSTISNKYLHINGTVFIDEDWTISATQVTMGEGAQIIVNNNAKLTLSGGTTLEGCAHMWKGITIEPGGTLFCEGGFEENAIKDAEFAIQPKSGATIHISNTTFDRNHISIYTAPSSSTQNVTTTALKFNTFICSEPLKPTYLGQLTTPGELSYAMAELNKTVGIDFGKNNTADGLVNGLLAYNSTFSMTRCTIKNLQSGIPTQLIQRRGVHAFRCAYAKVTHSRIEETHEAIYMEKSNLQADLNVIQNTMGNNNSFDRGISAIDCINQQVRIRDNQIRLWGDAIYLSNIKNMHIFTVRGNEIKIFQYVNNPTPAPVTGIKLHLSDAALVYDNIIYNLYHTTGSGIEAISSFRCNFQTNETHNFEKGYSLQGGGSHKLIENRAYFGNKGFENKETPGNTYCRNISADQTQEGWYFRGYCKKSNGFKCNNIGTAETGLYLWGDDSYYAELGVQDNTGNSWASGQFGTWGAFNAYAGNILNNINDSKFIMPSSQTPTWSTGSGPVLWFVPTSPGQTPLVCDAATCPLLADSDPVPVGMLIEPGGGAVLDGSDTRTALGEIEHQGLGWMAQQHLYERLASSTTLLNSGNNEIQGFYANESQGTIGQLHNQRLAMNAVVEPNSVQLAVLNTGTENTIYTLDSIEALRDQLEQTGQWEIGLPQIKERTYALATYSNALPPVWQTLDLQRVNAGPNLLVSNAAIAPVNTLADNEIQLNRILLEANYFQSVATNTTGANTVPGGNEEWESQIKAIADQCPIDGGRSVYEARGWCHRFDPRAIWDDEGICGANRGMERRNAMDTKQPLSYWVLPNPANEQVQIVSIKPQLAHFSLFRFDGRLAQQINLSENATIDLRHLPNGIYTYTILAENGTIQHGKLVVQH